MITYKYSLLEDLRWAYRTVRNRRWLKEKKIIFFFPNPSNFIKLLLHKPKQTYIDVNSKIICYWISSGTWGSYTPPNKIFICPWKNPDLKKTIIHELKHLKYYHEVANMSHEKKEDYINKMNLN